MPLSDLLDEAVDADCWDRERMATPVRVFTVHLHSAGLSLRETVRILDLLDVDRSHGAVWDWMHRPADDQDDPPRSIVIKRSIGYRLSQNTRLEQFTKSGTAVGQAPSAG